MCTYNCFNVTKKGRKNKPIKYIFIKYTKGHLNFNCTGVVLVLSECIYQIKIGFVANNVSNKGCEQALTY